MQLTKTRRVSGNGSNLQQPSNRRGRPLGRIGLKSIWAGSGILGLSIVGNLDRRWLVAVVWTPETRAECESKTIARFGMILDWCSLAIAFACWIAALTIVAAILTNKLADSGAWIAVVSFVAIGALFWLAGRAAKRLVEIGLKAKGEIRPRKSYGRIP
jgi:hypothetical protein